MNLNTKVKNLNKNLLAVSLLAAMGITGVQAKHGYVVHPDPYPSTSATGEDALIIGGENNTASGNGSFIGGGKNNTASGNGSFIGGGENNTASGNGSFALGFNNIASTEAAIALGNKNTINGSSSAAIGSNNTIEQDNVFILGSDTSSTQSNSVILGNGSSDKAATSVTNATIGDITYDGFAGVGSINDGVVAVGGIGTERQVVNVAAGNITETSTDAVNGSQVFKVAEKQNIVIATKADTSYVNSQNDAQNIEIRKNSQRINDLGYRVNELDEKLSGGVASAIALAHMPMPANAGEHMFTFGSGYFNNQAAIALGLSGSRSDGVLGYKIGVSYSEEGSGSFGVGGGYRWK